MMPVGECLFMGNNSDYAAWAEEVCGPRARAMSEDRNDRIVGVTVKGSAPRTVTLYLNVFKDENVLTQVVPGNTTWNIPTDSPFYSQASVALCE